MVPRLEEAELLRAVADQQVFCLLVVVEHHAVGFAADAGLFISAEGSVGRIGVVAIDPDAASLDAAAEMVAAVGIAAPKTSTEAVECVVGDFERIGLVFERGDGDNGAEYLFLEDAHAIVALEDCGLHVIAAIEFTAEMGTAATGEKFGAFLVADVDVAE